MYIRSLVIALALIFPSIALADTAPDATTLNGSSAASLGPSTSGGTSSNADGGVLQPAGGSPLQSTTGDATGLNPASTDPLQATSGNADQLKVLLGSESDGVSHDTASSTPWVVDSVVIGLVLVIGGGTYLWRRRLSKHV